MNDGPMAGEEVASVYNWNFQLISSSFQYPLPSWSYQSRGSQGNFLSNKSLRRSTIRPIFDEVNTLMLYSNPPLDTVSASLEDFQEIINKFHHLFENISVFEINRFYLNKTILRILWLYLGFDLFNYHFLCPEQDKDKILLLIALDKKIFPIINKYLHRLNESGQNVYECSKTDPFPLYCYQEIVQIQNMLPYFGYFIRKYDIVDIQVLKNMPEISKSLLSCCKNQFMFRHLKFKPEVRFGSFRICELLTKYLQYPMTIFPGLPNIYYLSEAGLVLNCVICFKDRPIIVIEEKTYPSPNSSFRVGIRDVLLQNYIRIPIRTGEREEIFCLIAQILSHPHVQSFIEGYLNLLAFREEVRQSKLSLKNSSLESDQNKFIKLNHADDCIQNIINRQSLRKYISEKILLSDPLSLFSHPIASPQFQEILTNERDEINRTILFHKIELLVVDMNKPMLADGKECKTEEAKQFPLIHSPHAQFQSDTGRRNRQNKKRKKKSKLLSP